MSLTVTHYYPHHADVGFHPRAVIRFIAVASPVGDEHSVNVEMAFFDADGISHSDAVRPPGGNLGRLYFVKGRLGIDVQAAVVPGNIELVPACLYHHAPAGSVIVLIPRHLSRTPIPEFDDTREAVKIQLLDFFLLRLHNRLYFTRTAVFQYQRHHARHAPHHAYLQNGFR